MRKYNISKFSKAVYWFAIMFGLAGLIITICGYNAVGITFEIILFSVATFITFLCGFYLIFFDAPSGKFSFDDKGITLFVGFKSYHHEWNQFKLVEIIPVSVESIGSKTVANMYVVLFSTRCLTLEERKDFMGKGRKDLNCVAWFQYRPEIVSEIIDCLPSQLGHSLRVKHIEVQENMNNLERLYNKD